MSTYICVGRTVVGAFTSDLGKARCINALAPGCAPQVKKCHPILTEKRVAKHCSNEAQQLGVRCYSRMLKRGEFIL